MIDEKKIFGMLQAKALGCLDENESAELNEFIDSGHLFPWAELGIYQNIASLLPLTLKLEVPEIELKDKVALRLIKLSEELKAKKAAEEQQLKALEQTEKIEEEIDEEADDFMKLDEPFIEPPIEIETESSASQSENKLGDSAEVEEPVFNLDDIVLPGYEEERVNFSEPVVTEQEMLLTETNSENLTDNMVLESEVSSEQTHQLELISNSAISEEMKLEENLSTTSSEEVKLDTEWIEPKQHTDLAETPVSAVKETLIEEVVDPNKPDFTKRSVAEKAFKTLEQDFDRLKYHVDEIEKKLKRNVLIAYLIVAFLAALVVIFFLKFNSDVNQLQKEIDFLKSRPTSELFPLGKISANYFS